MKKLRWVTDGGGGGFWELDVSTPVTLDGVARPVPMAGSCSGASDNHPLPLPLGISRGATLSRPKQIDFFQRFMSAPFVPSYSPAHGFSLQRVLTFPFADFWFATLLGQFNLQKFVSSLAQNGLKQSSDSSWLKTIARQLCKKSLYALNLCSEVLVTPDDTVLLSIEGYGDEKAARKKAVLHHKFLHHNLTVEAAWPELFVDGLGTYWDVPFSMAIDLASTAAESGASYHFSINHNAGRPKQHEDQVTNGVPTTLLPGLCIKNAFAFKKTVDFWRSKAPKLKLVQPFDMFLSTPHISASGVLGAVLAACLGDNSVGQQIAGDSLHFKPLSLRAAGVNSAIAADMFASVSFSMQHGNFQRLFFDLTRIYTRLDFPSGSKFVSGTIQLAEHLYNSQQLSLEAIQAICPKATVSLQQQIAGPFTFRVDSGITVDLKNSGAWQVNVNDPVFAIEYALQVLGSAKAVAWYSPRQKEFMMELRFFET